MLAWLAAVALLLGATAPGGAITLDDDAVVPVVAVVDDVQDDLLAEDAHADATTVIWHTQNRGNRGNDVKAIQHLLVRRGYSLSTDGVFGSGTESAVKDFQSRNGLSSDGIVGPATWEKLVVTAKRGDSGAHVKAIQMLLNQKKYAGLAVDGVFGSGTETAVINFQKHMGLSADGIVGPATWKRLVWHYEQPNNGLSGVCSHYDASKRWGTAATIGQLEAAGVKFYSRGKGEMSVGDISLAHGGDIVGHASHEVGLDYDVWLINHARSQCTTKCYYTSSCYDKYATLQLCQDIRATAGGHVKTILFNDPYVRTYCPSTYYSNHDDHLHIRYCEKVHWSSTYAC